MIYEKDVILRLSSITWNGETCILQTYIFYVRIWLIQAIEVSRRQAKVRESNGNPDFTLKLEAAEAKLQELKSNMSRLGKEAAAAMAAVEGQQQRLTLQRLIALVIYSAYLSFN